MFGEADRRDFLRSVLPLFHDARANMTTCRIAKSSMKQRGEKFCTAFNLSFDRDGKITRLWYWKINLIRVSRDLQLTCICDITSILKEEAHTLVFRYRPAQLIATQCRTCQSFTGYRNFLGDLVLSSKQKKITPLLPKARSGLESAQFESSRGRLHWYRPGGWRACHQNHLFIP